MIVFSFQTVMSWLNYTWKGQGTQYRLPTGVYSYHVFSKGAQYEYRVADFGDFRSFSIQVAQ